MSAPARDVAGPIEGCRPADVTPVRLDASCLESTAPAYLRSLKRDLHEEDLFPAELAVTARFDADCSLSTQAEADRLREFVRAASFLGVATITVTCEEIADPAKARPALEACAERAEREGVTVDVDGPITLECDLAH